MRTVDPLFVAMTKPAISRLGVPADGLLANFFGTFAITVFFIHRPPGFALGILVHVVMRELCRADPHFFWRWRQFFQTKARSTLTMTALWGGSRLQTKPTKVRRASDLRVSL